jgi:hypothetical protein
MVGGVDRTINFSRVKSNFRIKYMRMVAEISVQEMEEQIFNSCCLTLVFSSILLETFFHEAWQLTLGSSSLLYNTFRISDFPQ